MTFSFSCDNAHVSQQALFELKQRLIAAGWTCIGSGTGTGGGAVSPTGDLITTYSTTTDGVAGALTNRRAWWRMRAPDGRELLWQHGAFNVATDNVSVAYSRAAGFVGTGDGALAPDVAPTATDSFVVMGERRASLNLNGDSFSGQNTITRVDYIIGDADEGWSFACYLRDSAGAIRGGFFYDCVENPNPDDDDPFVLWSPGCYSNPFATATGTLSSIYSMGWSFRDPGVSPLGTITQSNFGPWSRPQHSAPREDAAARHALLCPAYFGQYNVLDPSAVNPYDSNIDLLRPVKWWCAAINPNSGQSTPFGSPPPVGAIKGESRFIKAISATGLTNRDTPTDLSLIAQAGGFWLLWDGATTPT